MAFCGLWFLVDKWSKHSSLTTAQCRWNYLTYPPSRFNHTDYSGDSSVRKRMTGIAEKMIRIFPLALLFLFFSCTPNDSAEQDGWVLDSSEIIEHQEYDNRKIQVIYSTGNTDLLKDYDTSVVVQTFRDTLLLEEIHYNLIDGDSTKWSQRINRYNSSGLLIEEINSSDRALQYHHLYSYEQEKLIRTESVSILPNYNDMMEITRLDTLRSVSHQFYNTEGKCTRSITLSKDELTYELTGTTKLDTVKTFNQFDSKGNKVQSFSTQFGDTTFISRSEFDTYNREVTNVTYSAEYGLSTMKYQYDKRGNVISEITVSADFSHRILTEYDKQNRPISRKTYIRFPVVD